MRAEARREVGEPVARPAIASWPSVVVWHDGSTASACELEPGSGPSVIVELGSPAITATASYEGSLIARRKSA